ncbi:hypothetical protein BKA82DRAFT_1000831 [Pisolithus tinctorius]|uniref:Uncharacterized protein n=1 Tax=Pisolithus tinctorius Marx 270 TaxID=870435 RepID=A0A0C3K3A6_PISTI|nr:hypothetical protein BKA82DRAFT_1000831 [Pisolithus tinctorius]KIO03997.1 hypothetical protein M404DRAFT_1000831 [Pisolithus tinctorius Marx 270]
MTHRMFLLYPRTSKYDVEEGTWLRMDVHPVSADIAFDMAGGLYCLPACFLPSFPSNQRSSSLSTDSISPCEYPGSTTFHVSQCDQPDVTTLTSAWIRKVVQGEFLGAGEATL